MYAESSRILEGTWEMRIPSTLIWLIEACSASRNSERYCSLIWSMCTVVASRGTTSW